MYRCCQPGGYIEIGGEFFLLYDEVPHLPYFCYLAIPWASTMKKPEFGSANLFPSYIALESADSAGSGLLFEALVSSARYSATIRYRLISFS